MCIFCDILEGRVKEIPWVGKEPIKYERVTPLVDIHPERGSFGKEIGALSSWEDVPDGL